MGDSAAAFRRTLLCFGRRRGQAGRAASCRPGKPRELLRRDDPRSDRLEPPPDGSQAFDGVRRPQRSRVACHDSPSRSDVSKVSIPVGELATPRVDVARTRPQIHDFRSDRRDGVFDAGFGQARLPRHALREPPDVPPTTASAALWAASSIISDVTSPIAAVSMSMPIGRSDSNGSESRHIRPAPAI